MSGNDLARQQPATAAPITDGSWTPDQIALIKRTVIHGVGEATNDELALFEIVCRHTGLSPFLGQIWAIRRKEQVDNAWQERMTIQVGIAGYRLIAERTSRYEGMLGPLWCGEDGQWRDVWLAKEAPAAAKVGILKRGFREPLWAVATFAEFAQRTRNDQLTRFWRTMPANQLSKCAKALAFREAFPQETSGLYSDAELPEVEVDQVTGEIQSTGRQGSDPTPAQPAGPSVPSLDQVNLLRTVRAAKDLIYLTTPGFQALVPRAITALYQTDPHAWWDNTSKVDAWKQVLEYAVELADHEQHETAGAGAAVPPTSAPDSTSDPGRADRPDREAAEESATTPGPDDPQGGGDG